MKRNAFEALMSAKQKKQAPMTPTKKHRSDAKDALFQYTLKPETYSRSIMVDYDDDFVLIRDMYPKSTIHLLLIPRNVQFADSPPYEALRAEFLERVRRKIESLKDMLEYECTRRFGPLKNSQWMEYFRTGVHAVPSMNHLHIHLLTPDFCSPCLKTRAHHQSFSSPFFISLDKFPKSKAEVDEIVAQDWKKKKEMKCLRCRAEFSQMPALKAHLESCWRDWLSMNVVQENEKAQVIDKVPDDDTTDDGD